MAKQTEYFAFENLTWPEALALPREFPLVLPVGDPGPLDLLGRALGRPPRIGMLPPVPYGWLGSGLEVATSVLVGYVANLLAGLREDGFQRLHVLVQPDLAEEFGDLHPLVRQVPTGQVGGVQALPRLLAAAGGKVVLIPIGHTEQHALHLPLCTDTVIIDAISQGVMAGAPERAFSLPAMPYGVSTHRSAFAGTLNAGGRTFEDFYLAVIDQLVGLGVDRLYLISGHGGNCSYLVNIVKTAGERHRRIFCATSWLYLSGQQGVRALQAHRSSKLGGMGHACELETSLMLHLRPELVMMDRVVDEIDFIATPSYFMDWIESGALVANPPWEDDTRTGAYGAGSHATPEKGETWLRTAIAEKLAHVEEIHEQFRRREARRQSGFGRWEGLVRPQGDSAEASNTSQ